jgi:hypothetical protein
MDPELRAKEDSAVPQEAILAHEIASHPTQNRMGENSSAGSGTGVIIHVDLFQRKHRHAYVRISKYLDATICALRCPTQNGYKVHKNSSVPFNIQSRA